LITKDRISAWLNEPHQLQELAPRALLQFAKEYPYFVPAHYLRFIGTGQYADALGFLQQVYPVNPVLLHQLVTQSEELPVTTAEEEPEGTTTQPDTTGDILIQPVSADDYFLQQGIHISGELPEMEDIMNHIHDHHSIADTDAATEEDEKALMVVMSFAEWLKHISSKNRKAREEEAEQKALKAMWQQQKLAAAIEEESDEIPEQVFEMAVNSISRKDELVSESLAEVYVKQGKKTKAIELYQKLSLLNPEKNAYFAAKIESLQKDL